jgi:hypothetical protein
MTDIVDRLRDPSKGSPRWGDTMAEAAEEIERLRAALLESSAVLIYVEKHGYADHRYLSDTTLEEIRTARAALGEATP